MVRFLFIGIVVLLAKSSFAVPLNVSEDNSTDISDVEEVTALSHNSSEGKQDLYVIKSVVYEIGILTEAGNNTDLANETHEQIDISFFDPNGNETFVDLSSIPVPIQTNVSGVSITGIIPANFGNLNLFEDGTPTLNGSHFPLFPNKEVKISHNISTVNKNSSSSILSGLPDILGLKDLVKISGNNSGTINDEEEK